MTAPYRESPPPEQETYLVPRKDGYIEVENGHVRCNPPETYPIPLNLFLHPINRIQAHRCAACGEIRTIHVSSYGGDLYYHAAVRHRWWHWFLGCREKHPHFHTQCHCGYRWLVGYATTTFKEICP